MKPSTILWRTSLSIYLFFALCPGLVCAGYVREFFLASEGGSLFLGLMVTPIPFVLLASYLLYLTSVPRLTIEEINASITVPAIIGTIALLGVFVALIALANSTEPVSRIASGEIQGNEYDVAGHTLFTFIGGCSMGLIVMCFGFITFLFKKGK